LTARDQGGSSCQERKDVSPEKRVVGVMGEISVRLVVAPLKKALIQRSSFLLLAFTFEALGGGTGIADALDALCLCGSVVLGGIECVSGAAKCGARRGNAPPAPRSRSMHPTRPSTLQVPASCRLLTRPS
jgi:hypothetical protein